MNGCLGKLRKLNTEAARTAAKSAFGKDVNSPYSEIVAGLRWAMLNLVPQVRPQSGNVPVRLLVFSDGDQNSVTGASFYRGGRPREIVAAQELKLIEMSERELSLQAGSVDVWWIGLGLQPPGAKFYMSPQAIEERRKFWIGVSRLYGAKRMAIGLALTDDGF